MMKRHALVPIAIVTGVLAGLAATADPIARNHPNKEPVDRRKDQPAGVSGLLRPTVC